MTGRRVAIVGAGAVGASAAYALALSGTCHEIILYDIMPEVAIGKAIDIAQATNYSPRGTVVRAAIKPEDLLNINAGIVKEVSQNIKKYSPNAVILCVSNPLDVMTFVVQKVTGWDRHRIVGMSGALDGSRMAYQIYQKTGYGAAQTRAMVIGEHGEHMIPYPEITDVGGIPLTQILSKEDIEDVIEKTKNGGAEIVSHLKTSAFYAPGRAISAMVESLLSDEDKVISSSAILDGEYGYKDVAIGVPCVLGASGIKKIIELDLDDETKIQF